MLLNIKHCLSIQKTTFFTVIHLVSAQTCSDRQHVCAPGAGGRICMRARLDGADVSRLERYL